jgi:hypothetical protein
VQNLTLTNSRPPLRWMVLEAKRHGLKIDDSRFRTRLDMAYRDAPRVEHKPPYPSFVSMRHSQRRQQTPPGGDRKSTVNRLPDEAPLDDHISIHESTQCCNFWAILEILPIRRLTYTGTNTTTNW